jgi:hypothetical protein
MLSVMIRSIHICYCKVPEEMISDDDTESMSTKQGFVCFSTSGFCLAAYHPNLSTPSSNKIMQDMVMNFLFPV